MAPARWFVLYGGRLKVSPRGAGSALPRGLAHLQGDLPEAERSEPLQVCGPVWLPLVRREEGDPRVLPALSERCRGPGWSPWPPEAMSFCLAVRVCLKVGRV